MFKKTWIWTVIGVVALLVRILASYFPQTTEAVYSRSIFPIIRSMIDGSIARLPFPTFYIFLGILSLLIGTFFYYLRSNRGWKKKFQLSIKWLSNVAGLMIFLFLVLWGFNYQRIPLYQQLKLLPAPLALEELLEEVQLTEQLLIHLRSAVTEDTVAIEEIVRYDVLENVVRAEVQKTLNHLGYHVNGHPRTKAFYPAGFLNKMGILGIYFPFTGESYIDPALHDLEKPFTIAHEMAHSYGITDEGEANFVAWVICSNSEDRLLQYAGNLQLLRYQLNNLYKIEKKSYYKILRNLNIGIKNDMVSIKKKAEEIKPISLAITRKSNDIFLKTQGVKAGIKSYSQLPMLAYAWRYRSSFE
jgi:hypothetical protein